MLILITYISFCKILSKEIRAVFGKVIYFNLLRHPLFVRKTRLASLSAMTISFGINNNYVLDEMDWNIWKKPSEGQKVLWWADLFRIISLHPIALSSPVTKPGQWPLDIKLWGVKGLITSRFILLLCRLVTDMITTGYQAWIMTFMTNKSKKENRR